MNINSVAQQVVPQEKSDPREALPILPLMKSVVFPCVLMPLLITRPASIKLIRNIIDTDRTLLLVAQRDEKAENPMPDDLYQIGTLARIQKITKGEEDTLQIVVQGLERIQLDKIISNESYMCGRYSRLEDHFFSKIEAEDLAKTVLQLIKHLVKLIDDIPDNIVALATEITDIRKLVYITLSLLPLPNKLRQEILELNPFEKKMRKLIDILQHEIQLRESGGKLISDVQERMSVAEREYFLLEQVAALQKDVNGFKNKDVSELERQLAVMKLPQAAREEVSREMIRLKQITNASAEYGMIRAYLEWMSSLPWSMSSGTSIDTKHARKVLDKDHFDLDKVKDRIIEYLAVKKLRELRHVAVNTESDEDKILFESEPILCFVGAPGVGKTSLGQSIARALGRKFVRLSLGGMRDEAEIRGHRRTYIGAMPGRIIQALKEAGTKDPVFMLDELDKIGRDWRGDPAAALLEVFDPSQNYSFVDHYLGVPFDLSQVLFISTANTLEDIPDALLDRMEIIHLTGYTEKEKIDIAQHHLIPKQLLIHALNKNELDIGIDALQLIIRNYTREAGVRHLDRKIAKICRKVVHKVVEGSNKSIKITAKNLKDYLGAVYYFDEVAERTERPGVATGLVWTSVGGDILFIEATMIKSRESKFMLTGMLGSVMRESALAAFSYVRANAELLNIDAEIFNDKIVHLHVPEGAIPKDGPSAGVTIITALASLATNRCVRGDVAMTGEITLRGKVLPVGGIKEKILAAHRAGIKTIILPKYNEFDLEEIPPELRQELKFIFVDKCEDVLKHALEENGKSKIKSKRKNSNKSKAKR